MVQAISEIVDDPDGVRPVIVQFQNSELQKGEESKLQTAVFKKPNNSTVVAVASRSILYTGEVDPDEKNELYNRFLLVSNKKTGKVRLIAVDTALVTPQLTQKRSSNEVTDNSINLNSSISQLNKEFGSKKIKRITEQRERLQMNIDDVKEQLEQTVAGVQMNESESFVVDSAENDSSYRPPINRNAATREQVYILDDIVPESVLDTLEEEATNLLSSELDTSDLSPFVKQKVGDLQDSSSDIVKKVQLFIYIDYLIKYIAKPAKSITKKFIICPSSPEVNSYILDRFSVLSNTGRARPMSLRDKTICNILVLSMIACDYELDLESLSKNIKVGVKKLQEIGRVLAFSAHSKNKNMMILKMPLPPAVSISPKKRKR